MKSQFTRSGTRALTSQITAVILILFLFITCKNSELPPTPKGPDLIADFETGTAISSVDCSGCTNTAYDITSLYGSVVSIGICATGSSGPQGAYYYSVTGTVACDQGYSLFGPSIGVFSASGGIGTDFTGKKKLVFDYRLSATTSCFVVATIGTPAYVKFIRYWTVPTINDNAWHTITLPIETFPESLYGDVMSDVGRIDLEISSTYSNATETVYAEFSLDNIKLLP